MKLNPCNKGFTLAEIMIVLTVIGILTAVLLPTALHSTPDSNIMKFKKANTTLYRIITELVSSGKYNADGDLGKKPDGSGELITNTKYFCKSIADILTTKAENCSGNGTAGSYINMASFNAGSKTVMEQFQEALDQACADAQSTIGNEILTSEDIVWYEASPATPFGSTATIEGNNVRIFTDPEETPANAFKDENGFDSVYKVYCIDVDGGNGGNNDDTEPPFGYGIRADGKIMPGARAVKWTQESIRTKE